MPADPPTLLLFLSLVPNWCPSHFIVHRARARNWERTLSSAAKEGVITEALQHTEKTIQVSAHLRTAKT